jgi:lysyl endopeptidase
MKQLNLVLLLSLFTYSLNAQVFTRHLSDNQKLASFMPYPYNKEISYYLQPEVNFERVLEEDRAKKDYVPRFAVKVDQNYTIKDGTWLQMGDLMLWQIGISAPKARSLNFLISDIVFPEGTEMYIFSKDEKIIHGPILSSHIYEKVYATDVIEAQNVMIAIKTPTKSANSLQLVINGVCQGIKSTLRSWQSASNCNFDVNCPQGNGWQNERDAVARILMDGGFFCTAALVNNQCQDLRPYLLTAFHCVDRNQDNQLSAIEIQNLSIYSYRFKYEAVTPTCPGMSTGGEGTWITFSGSTFRAGNRPSDFVLAELNGSLNQPNTTLAGWDRNITQPTQVVTTIHHPRGDAKKYPMTMNH